MGSRSQSVAKEFSYVFGGVSGWLSGCDLL